MSVLLGLRFFAFVFTFFARLWVGSMAWLMVLPGFHLLAYGRLSIARRNASDMLKCRAITNRPYGGMRRQFVYDCGN